MLHPDFKINGHSILLENYIETSQNSRKLHLQEIGAFLKDWVNDDDFITISTSGSTGKPKLIDLKKQHMINSALATASYFNVFENTKALLCLSANYVAGKMMIVRAMVLGWDLYIVPPSLMPLNEIAICFDFCAMVPIQVENSLANLHLIKQLIIGGAPISSLLLSRLIPLETNCYATYGMTETITHIAVQKLKDKTSYYHVLPSVKIKQDDRGCLVINAPRIASETIITNDVVSLISETEFEWLGRYDNVINSGGVKLFPEQIEKKISYILSQRYFVIGMPDLKLGTQLVLIIERKDMISEVVEKQIHDCLSKYERPKKIYYIPSFIETLSGKVNRIETLKLM